MCTGTLIHIAVELVTAPSPGNCLYIPFSLRRLSKTTWRILSVKGGGVPPNSAKENSAKKQVF